MLIRNASLARMTDADPDYALMRDGAVAIDGGQIAWVGPDADLPPEYRDAHSLDAEGRLLTPALIDCHTHLVHGGNRAREFEMRLEGASYEEIARAGGGIVSTVSATRAASVEQLFTDACARVDALIAEGVGTIEIKSGYGLDQETELKMLRVARRIGRARPVYVVTSFLGAHAVPRGQDADGYIDDVCLPALEAAHSEGLVDAVDGFCEGIAFDVAQIARVFEKARSLGLPVKLHAEQLSHIGGTKLAADFGALSADHVEYATEADARALAQAGSVAVLLPGAFYTLHETQKPPVDAFRAAGVPMAVATDWNPGSSPMGSVLLAMNMGCTLFGLTPAEALAGTTRNAARALGLRDRGMIAPGMRADLALWDVEEPAELSYRIGVNPLYRRIFGGQL
ncbi:MAG: imidazolonepropionase [Pseudomonadota bacterium]